MNKRSTLALSLAVVALALAVGAGTTVLAQGATATPTAPSSLFWASLAQRLNTTPVALEQSVRDAAKDVVSQRVSASGASKCCSTGVKKAIRRVSACCRAR